MSQELEKVREAIAKEYDKECPHSYAGAGYDSGPQLCEINDKLCLLESGDNCSIWNDIKIDKMVVRMPKAKNPVKQEEIDWYKEHWGNKENNTCAFCDANLGIGYNVGSIEQCHLLAKTGYRKVPSGDEIGKMLMRIPDNVGVGDYINHWLLERDNE